ncbi:MAG: hypothetical protein WCG25_02375 [bacterium]
MNNIEKKNIIKQLCNTLKIINKTPYTEFIKKFPSENIVNWHDTIISKIRQSLKKIEEKKLLSPDFIEHIKKFVEDNNHSLDEQKMGLVYRDTHFDNILVKDNKIS